MRTKLMVVGLLLGAGACAEPHADAADRSDKSEVAQAPADNTKKNERDRDPASLTPLDQGESEADRTVTQQVRQGVVADDSLSVNAQNVKIITQEGVVTLRGPVQSATEKQRIEGLARQVQGVKRVDNQLQIAAQ